MGNVLLVCTLLVSCFPKVEPSLAEKETMRKEMDRLVWTYTLTKKEREMIVYLPTDIIKEVHHKGKRKRF